MCESGLFDSAIMAYLKEVQLENPSGRRHYVKLQLKLYTCLVKMKSQSIHDDAPEEAEQVEAWQGQIYKK